MLDLSFASAGGGAICCCFAPDNLHGTAAAGVAGTASALPVVFLQTSCRVGGDAGIEGLVGTAENVNVPALRSLHFLTLKGTLKSVLPKGA